MNIFYNRCALRPSCYECPFATTERQTDITIGDFWHIDEKMPGFYNKNCLDYRESNTVDCWQENLEHSTPISDHRADFWNDCQKKGIEYVMKKYGTVSFGISLKDEFKEIMGGVSLSSVSSCIYPPDNYVCFSARRAA